MSDEQILFGDDKELNRYVSVKKIAPYEEKAMRLRNSKYKQMIPKIKKSVKTNKQILRKGLGTLQQMRHLRKLQDRKEAGAKRRQNKLKLVNLSSKQKERSHFVPASRLESYGLKEGDA